MDPYSGKIYTGDDVAQLRASKDAKDQEIAARLVMIEGRTEDIEHLARVAQAGNRAARRAAARADRKRGR